MKFEGDSTIAFRIESALNGIQPDMDVINFDTKTTVANHGPETMEIGNFEGREAPRRQYTKQKREYLRNKA